MINSSLGIYIDKNLIKYAKLQKNKDNIKLEAYNVSFYDDLELEIDKIINETGSSNIPICINLSNEIYNYFDVLAILNKKDRNKFLKMEFDKLYKNNENNLENLESRVLLTDSENNPEKLKAIYVSTDKTKLAKISSNFKNSKISSITPITTSITNLLDKNEDKNVIIVNLENTTKITTIIDGNINKIDTINIGMEKILDTINETENSFQKSYEVCKNTTIYTGQSELINPDGNEHVNEMFPIISEIIGEVQKIINQISRSIDKIYITGLGSVINNIDLYFQEYFEFSKCEILKPKFLNTPATRSSFKDYIEVNSAIALALEGIEPSAIGNELNFKKISYDKNLNDLEMNTDSKVPFDSTDKLLVRIISILCCSIIIYFVFTNVLIMDRINSKKQEAEAEIQKVDAQIEKARADVETIKEKADYYSHASGVIRRVVSDSEDPDKAVAEIAPLAIPNMLNLIAEDIPTEVTLLSIKNTIGKHIVIEAVAPQYDQLGYFKALVSTKGTLLNVKSTSGQKVEGYSNDKYPDAWIYVTIEGDLP